MFAGSPSKLQEEVPSKTEDGSVKRFRRHSSNASQEEKRKKPRLVQFHQAIFPKMKKNLNMNMNFQTKNFQSKCLKMTGLKP